MTIALRTPTTTTATTTTATATTAATSHHPAGRSTSDDVKALPNVLRSEWIKLSSLRANKAILGLTTATGGFVAWAVATLVTNQVQTVSEVFVFSTVLTGVIAAVAGILLFSSEAQHGTLASVLTAQPARWVIVAAKAMMATAFGFVLGAAGMAASVGGAVLGGLELGDASAMAATTLWALLFTGLSALLGLGVGMIVRHSSAAISALLVWGLVVENLLTLFLSEQVSRFLPFVAGNNLLGIVGEGAFAESAATALTRAQDALVFGGYTAAAVLIGTVLLYRRDTN
ncbi:MAG: type transport system permease protein [Kribbellaceae bacterium]|jgi:ABC-type transport system involved in multi-copper enzyme maturation permease subunit|nr:type transport system permease protein [Kribbellaceae bacterium]